MTAAIAAGRRLFPRGYADFGYQLLIWFGFLAAYQVARGVADRDPDPRLRQRLACHRHRAAPHRPRRADAPGLDPVLTRARDARLVDVLELRVHRDRARAALGLLPPQRCLHALPQHDPARERAGPDRLRLPADGTAALLHVDRASPTRSASSAGSIMAAASFELAANPYAAMPSLHAADALIVGVDPCVGRPRPVLRRSGCSGRRGSGSP